MYPSIEEKLFKRRTIDANGCWLWHRPAGDQGYGEVRVDGKRWKVHRLAAHLWLGFDPENMPQVLHRCDVKLCFNPKHLYVGTPADNSRDYFARRSRI